MIINKQFGTKQKVKHLDLPKLILLNKKMVKRWHISHLISSLGHKAPHLGNISLVSLKDGWIIHEVMNTLPISHLYQEHLNIHLMPGYCAQNTHLSTLYVKTEEVNPGISKCVKGKQSS